MRYQVRGFAGNGVGAFTAVEIEARDEQDAGEQALSRGIAALSVRPRSALLGWAWPGRARFPLLLFSQELKALLEAGLPIVESLETLVEKEDTGDARRVLEGIVARLFEGQTFSAALNQFPAAFPPLYVALMRASERTGDLAEALSRFIVYQSQVDVVRKKISGALIYPALLAVVGALVVIFLMAYVVPKFSAVYADMGQNIPQMSHLLLQWGMLVQDHGLVLLAAALAMIGGGAHLALRRASRLWIARKLWRMPVIGSRLRIYHLARYYRTLGMLQHGGIPILVALDMVRDLLPDLLRDDLAGARRLVEEGQPISRAMEAHTLTTPVSVRMLRVGERTGRMGEMMERIAAFYDEDVSRWTERFLKLFEPLLMIGIGVVIGMVVVLMYMPIFELAGSIR